MIWNLSVWEQIFALDTAADARAIKSEEPDIIVLATGGRENIRSEEKWGHAEGLSVSSWDVLNGKVKPAKNVLIYDGMGQHAGAGLADFVAAKGAQVEIITPGNKGSRRCRRNDLSDHVSASV